MGEINYSRLPPQQGFVVDLDAVPRHSNLGQQDDQPAVELSRPIGTNDLHIAYARTEEAGSVVPWHTHNQAQYQIIIPLEGRIKQLYKDNDGEVHSATAGPGKLIYLPSGAHNQVEVVERPARSLAIECQETWNARVDHVVGPTSEEVDHDNIYDPADPYWGLWYDNLRGVVHEIVEDAVTRY